MDEATEQEVGSAPQAADHSALQQLRAENDLLRTRLSASETVAQEREQRIEDLIHALQGLPAAWMEHLERTEEEAAPDEARASTVIEVLAARSAVERGDLSRAETAWKEVRSLRDRLEQEHLDRELERIRKAG